MKKGCHFTAHKNSINVKKASRREAQLNTEEFAELQNGTEDCNDSIACQR
jgi:hypothetical protein